VSSLVIIPPEDLRAMLQAAVREGIRVALAQARAGGAEEDGYLSVQRAADYADVHPDTIRAWIKAGKLLGYRAGRELRVLRSDLRRFLADVGPNSHRMTAEEEAATILSRRRSG
jgi:excisionase family DNA binding protein